ncbi:glycoside hydrolase [Pholiota conissans]|uniref:Glycoside hydrolase n=1 Tax=Pholiota conissans TaxID=109636 RepID=A0A9P6D0L6_9AGAR|nr:glycoside hydrolase [Pholiota conissans]
MSLSHFPPELIDEVIQHLAPERNIHVKCLALTCRSLLPICRRYLFETISITICSTQRSQSAKNIAYLLQKSPEIADYARHFHLHLILDGIGGPFAVPQELKMFRKLESYTLTANFSGNPLLARGYFSSIPPSYDIFDKIALQVKEALLHPIPTLRSLTLQRIANFPFSELPLYFPNIHSLDLHCIRIDTISTQLSQSVLKPIKLERFYSVGGSEEHVVALQKLVGLRQTDGNPIVDISSLKNLDIVVANGPEWMLTSPVLLHSNQLQTLSIKSDKYLHLGAHPSSLDLSGLGKLLLASRMTLKEISIYNESRNHDQNPLHGFCEMLEVLGSYPNVLETLSYSLGLDTDFICTTGAEWTALDRVISTHPWPMLKTLSIDLFTNILEELPEDEGLDAPGYVLVLEADEFKERLQALPRKRLPMLYGQARKDLDFKFTVHFYQDKDSESDLDHQLCETSECVTEEREVIGAQHCFGNTKGDFELMDGLALALNVAVIPPPCVTMSFHSCILTAQRTNEARRRDDDGPQPYEYTSSLLSNSTCSLLFTFCGFAVKACILALVTSINALQFGFPYGGQKVRGVSLSGWLVLEPWITPTIFDATNDPRIVDEYTYKQYQNHSQALVKLQHHWDTFITEADFAAIAAAGLNHVRVPIGFWAFDLRGGESYIQGQLAHLKKAVTWAQKYNLKVLISLHGAPGSQNGFTNSGQKKPAPEWQTQAFNIARTKDIIQTLGLTYRDKVNVVPMIATLNEPAGYSSPTFMSTVKQVIFIGIKFLYYDELLPSSGMTVMAFSGGSTGLFQPLSYWQNSMVPPKWDGVLMDTHIYHMLTQSLNEMTNLQHKQEICNKKNYLYTSSLPLLVGEWSPIPNDCAKYWNGMGAGSRYDGTYANSVCVGSCIALTGKASTFSAAYKSFLAEMWQLQAAAYEDASMGWIQNSWKTKKADEWSYQAGLANGWLMVGFRSILLRSQMLLNTLSKPYNNCLGYACVKEDAPGSYATLINDTKLSHHMSGP